MISINSVFFPWEATMRRRMLLIFGLLIFVVAGAIIIITQVLPAAGGKAQAATTPTPAIRNINVVLVTQDISVGTAITADMVQVGPWPSTYDLANLVSDPANVIGRRAKTDLRRGEPIFSTQVAETGTAITYPASDLSLKINPKKVAIAVPIGRLSSVAYGITMNDHIMVMATLMFIEIDPGLQTIVPNDMILVNINAEGNIAFQQIPGGRTFKEDPLSNVVLASFYVPSEKQRGRMTSVILVQDARVINVGNANASTASFIAQPTAKPNGEATPVPTKQNPDIIIIEVSPEEALAINYVLRMSGDITYAIRSAGDISTYDIPSLDLKRLMEVFKIDPPAKLTYGTNPRVDTPQIPVLGNDVVVQAK
jgi:Flp pilus assembly protein CpaB